MRGSRWIACLESFFLSFLLSFCACMCIPSAFRIPVEIGTLAAVCIGASAVFSVCFTLHLGLVPPILLAFSAGYFSRFLLPGIEGLLLRLSRFYDMAYGCGWFYWSQTPPYDADVTPAILAVGGLLCLIVTWTMCRQKRAWGAVLLSVLPLCACLVVTDTVPDIGYLFGLLLGLGILILSHTVRRQNMSQGNRLTALAVLPVFLALLLLFGAIPQNSYRGQQRADALLHWVQGISEEGVSSPVVEKVQLDRTGQLLQLHTPVMNISCDEDTTLYLYQQGYGLYDGKSWFNRTCADRYRWMDWDAFVSAGKVRISTRELHVMQFVPYHADPDTSDLSFNVQNGLYENKELLYSYEYDLLRLKDSALSAPVQTLPGGLQFPVGEQTPEVLALPPDTAAWAKPLAQSLTVGKQTVREQAAAIADYVRSSASYSRATGRMPEGYTDFARWFLEESDTGYCVHFATAATVLLRAAGIHAQYVTGYMVETRAEEDTVVYLDQAHAWTEYYDPAYGWCVLESTPAEGLPSYGQAQQIQPTAPSAPHTPVPSTPSETPKPTEPPQPESAVWQVLYGLCLIPALVLLVLGQWQLRLRLWTYRIEKADPNPRALLYWSKLTRLAKALHTQPDPALYRLALKAKFSQHTLTEQALRQLEDALDNYQKQLRKKPWYLQPIYTLLLALY